MKPTQGPEISDGASSIDASPHYLQLIFIVTEAKKPSNARFLNIDKTV